MGRRPQAPLDNSTEQQAPELYRSYESGQNLGSRLLIPVLPKNTVGAIQVDSHALREYLKEVLRIRTILQSSRESHPWLCMSIILVTELCVLRTFGGVHFSLIFYLLAICP
eukprot:COSAG02_NODE_918_length_15945_cov_5.640752_9_plen_111_part_00